MYKELPELHVAATKAACERLRVGGWEMTPSRQYYVSQTCKGFLEFYVAGLGDRAAQYLASGGEAVRGAIVETTVGCLLNLQEVIDASLAT